MTIHQALTYASDELGDYEEKDALIYPLLAYCLSSSKEYIWANPSKLLTQQQYTLFESLLSRAKLHEPLAYLTGVKEFYGRPFFITRDTLIPRPETELLVDKMIKIFKNHPTSHPSIIDVGTGSGNIAITLSLELPSAAVYAIDVSSKALEVANRNAKFLEAPNVNFLQGSLLEPLVTLASPGSIDAIAANLPYISDEEFSTLPATVKDFEPELALRSGGNADNLNHQLLSQAKAWLARDGVLLYETTNGRLVQWDASSLHSSN